MYHYKIDKFVYDEMILGRKNIELRLLNEKSVKIKQGDIIRFEVLEQELFLDVEVVDKYIYSCVDELWENKDILLNSSIYSNKEEFIKLMSEIFGKNNVLNSKIVGIKFKLI